MKRILRSIIAALVIAILAVAVATAALADDIAGADFNSGKMHWSISADGVLTISGEGTMPDYSESVNAPWYSYRSQIKSIAVEEGVTGIGNYAFYQLTNATSISLPDSLLTLGGSCFSSCSSLKSVSIPDGVQMIPYQAFEHCSAIESIDLPDGLTSVGGYAFYRCSSLKSITIPEGITELRSDMAFSQCSSLKSITLPSTLQYLDGYYTFTGTNITEIYFSGTLAQWLNIRFSKADYGVPMSASCNIFIQGEKLTNLIIPEGITHIPDLAFYGSNITSVMLTDSVTSVGTNAFANCSQLKRVYYVGEESEWTSIAWNTGNDALIDADRRFISSLDDVNTISITENEHGTVTASDIYCIEGDVITISAQPELGWRLKSVRANGKELAGKSFIAEADTDYIVTAEFEFYMNVIDSGSCGANLIWYLFENNELLISGTGDMYDYYGDSPWYKYHSNISSIILEEGITSIGNYAFYYCSLLGSIDIPKTVNRIGTYAFEGCNIKTVTYPGTVSDWLKIEFGDSRLLSKADYLYFDNELVTDLIIPEGTVNINSYAFRGYKGLNSVTFPDGLKTIGNYAFGGCTGIEYVVLPAGVESIGTDAFRDCDLIFAEFKGDAPSVGSSAFYNNNNFTIYYHAGTNGWESPKWNGYYAAIVEEPEDYTTLDSDNRNAQGILFTLNESARTAVVGDGSTSDNNSGYYGAQKGAVVIPDAVNRNGIEYRVIGIGPNAFSRNKHVTSVSIGSDITSVIPSAFTGCPELKEFTVSENNEYYSAIDGVLYDISGIYLYVYPGGKTDESFIVPTSVKTIGGQAFYDNRYLKNLTVGNNVTAIYKQAFCGLPELYEITLPFIGTRERTGDDAYYYSSEQFSSVFGSGYYYRMYNSAVRTNLKKATITGGQLFASAFSGCASLQEIAVASIPSAIPQRCFYDCTSLEKINFAGHTCEIGELELPDGIETISSGAFYGCKGITSVSLPASLTSMSSDAFSGSGLEKFSVASGNRNFSTDKWGVLYNYNKTALIQYPSCRRWPYYNVAETAKSIRSGAFSGCDKLVNLYFPNSVTSIDNGAISSCPYLTLCCYLNSAAYNYALNNNLTAWYMDNKTLQGIRVYSLPEQTVQFQGKLNMQGLYVVGNYGGKELQIDDYTLSYDQRTSGIKTVTVEYEGKTVTFEMVLYVSDEGNIISFRCDENMDGKMVMISVYNSSDKMLYTGSAVIIDGNAQVGVSDSVYNNADYAKLFVVDESTFAPAANSQKKAVA